MKKTSSREAFTLLALRKNATIAAVIVGIGTYVLALGCSSQEGQLREARAEVNRAMARGDLEAARSALERLRKSEPATPEAVQQIANLMVRAGEAPQALWLLEDGLQRFPERHDLRLVFARVALMLGEASRALAAVEPIESDSLFHADGLVLRARAMLELGDLEQALAILDEADERYPELASARRVQIQVLFQEQRFDEALKLVKEAKERASSEAERRELRVLEARARGAKGEREEALAILLEVAEEEPDDFGAWSLLAQVMSGLDRREEAIDLIESALEENPERRQLYTLLAGLHAAADRRDQAEEVLRRFIEISQSPSAYMALVRFHRIRGDLDEALAVLDEALEELPDQPMLESARVKALLNLERVDEARALVAEMEAEERAREWLELDYLRARIELAEGETERAAERLRNLVPKLDRADTRFYLGRALEELGDLEGAKRAYELSVRRSPSTAEPVFALLRVAEKRSNPVGEGDAARRLMRFPEHRLFGFQKLTEALLELEDFEAAEGVARRFLEERPDALEAHLALARTLGSRGRTEEAEQVLAGAEEKLGPSRAITTERSVLLALSDRADAGIAALEQALEEAPDDTDLMRKLAALYFEKGDFESGSALVDRALELEPENLEPLRARIVYAAVNGPLEVARRDAERYLEERPLDHEIHFRLGSVYERLGRADEAIASYQRSAELAEGAFAPRNNLAVLFQKSGDLDAALELAHEAYQRADTDPDVLDTLGWIYFEQGLLDRAISILQEAHEQAPGSLGSLHLALAYREAERADEAQALLSDLVARADAPTEIRRQAEDALRTLVP